MRNSLHTHTSFNAALLGCGKMGSALLSSWLRNELISHVDVISPTPLPDEFTGDLRIKCYTQPSKEVIEADILIVAVKPQIIKEALQGIRAIISPNTAILSIAAGTTISTLESVLPLEQPVIRTMPNTPAAIGKGISASVANKNVTEKQKIIAQELLAASGKTMWVDDEGLIDTVTALSGSGPAYIFYLIEALSQAGENAGLETQMATELARQTVIGSAALAEHSPDESASTLRENVTSPNGTTQAALGVLMDGRFQNILNEAIIAAKNRAKELNA